MILYLMMFAVNDLLAEQLCIPSSARNRSVDDVPSIVKALENCGRGGTIVIPAGETFMIRSPLAFDNCISCSFQLEGTMEISDDLEYWDGKTAFLSFDNVINGTFTSLQRSGLIDGSGQKFWDYFAQNKTYRRPLLIQISHGSGIVFTNLKLKDAPFWFISITNGSNNITFSHLFLSAISTSASKAANTDGFDTNDSTDIIIENSFVQNGDDCVSFKNGTNRVIVRNLTCIASHGLSVGSLGLSPEHPYIVENVHVSDTKMINCTTATRIKFYPGGPSHGSVIVTNVTYRNIYLDNCDYSFQVDNCYESDPTLCQKNPSSAQLMDIHLVDVHGKTSSKYDPVVAKISCPPVGICDLFFTQWDIVAPSGQSIVRCSYYPHPSGITCSPDGPHSSTQFK